jgi:hypothetical protein
MPLRLPFSPAQGEKRLSNNFSAGIHYTWSAFIDDAEVFNPSSGGSRIPGFFQSSRIAGVDTIGLNG